MVHITKAFFSFIFICSIFISAQEAYAQSYYSGREKNIRLGLSVNPNLGWLRYENDQESSPKLGFSYGLIADLGFAKNYYFSTGLLINSINSRTEPALQAVDKNDPAIPKYKDIALKYVEVPLTIKLKSTENELGRFYGQFGFTMGVKVSAKEQLENNKKQGMSGADLFRLGLQIGGGAEWRLGNDMGFMTGLTFNNGFTRAIKDGKPRSSYAAVNIGLLF